MARIALRECPGGIRAWHYHLETVDDNGVKCMGGWVCVDLILWRHRNGGRYVTKSVTPQVSRLGWVCAKLGPLSSQYWELP